MTHRPFALGLSMLSMGIHSSLDGALRKSHNTAFELAEIENDRRPPNCIA
jgi:hypothetical protein